MVVRIGHVGPVSGPQAHYGKDNENGARMAVDDLNTRNIRFTASSSSSDASV